jgi:hypothetical protein
MFVEARFASGGGSYGRGRVISYTDRPTVTIEREDGTRFSWIADLVRVAHTETREECDGCGLLLTPGEAHAQWCDRNEERSAQ